MSFGADASAEKKGCARGGMPQRPPQQERKGNRMADESWVRYIAGLLLSAIAASALLGCAPRIQPEPPWEKDALLLIEQADTFFSKRQYDQAEKVLDSFFSRFPKSRHQDRALYLMGEMRLSLRDYQRALSYYKDIIEKYPASSYIHEARYKLGMCYFELKEYDLAIANLEDSSKITDRERLRRSRDMLAISYLAKKNYVKAITEYVNLAAMVTDERQRSGYRDRVREIIDKNLSEDELSELSDGREYPSDIALLRLSGLFMEQRRYRDALKAAGDFLERFPSHPEKTMAEMIRTNAASLLSAPRFSIGLLIPRTGQAAFFGDRVLQGVQIAVNEHNQREPERRVELIVMDTEANPEKASAMLSELAQKGAIGAIGPLLTKEAEAVASGLENIRIPVITPAASGPGIGKLSPWLFRNALTNANQAATAARYGLGLRLKRFIILYPDDIYGRDLARLFAKELEKKAKILASVAYPADTNDFGPWIKRVIEIDLRSRRIPIPEDEAERKKLFQEYRPGFDAAYLPGYADRVGLLIPQLAFYNIKGITLIGSNNWHSQELLDRAGRHAEGAVFIDGFAPENNDPAVISFVNKYRSAYQEDPDILSAQAYDAAMMMLSLIKEGKETPTALQEGLINLHNYQGISGTTSFIGTGEAHKTLFILKIEDGAFKLISR